MKNKLYFLGILLLLVGATAAPAQDAGRQTEAEAARIALTNALVQEVKNGKQATFSVRWDYLPETQALKDKSLDLFDVDGKGKLSLGAEFVLRNEILRDHGKLREWFKALPNRSILAKALSGGSLNDTDSLDKALAEGSAVWGKSLYEALNFDPIGFGESSVPWANYITSKRDYYAMRSLLLETSGAGAILTFDDTVRGPNPQSLSNGLEWHIRVFPLPSTAQGHFYRFAVSVQSQRLRKVFRGSSDSPAASNPKMAVKVGLLKEIDPELLGAPAGSAAQRKLYRFITLSVADDSTVVDAQALPGADQLKGLESTLSPSTGSTVLQIFGGASPSGLLGPLVANNSEANFYSGGLIGNGAPEGVLGLNYIFTEQPDGNLGFIYGIMPNSRNALFLGPSLTLGPFIMGIGARIFNRADEAVTARLAGTLSVDLSRLLTKHPQPIPIHPRLRTPSSEIWADSDSLYVDRILVIFNVWAPGKEVITLEMKRDASNKPVLNGFKKTIGSGVHYVVLPRGQYLLTASSGYNVISRNVVGPKPITVPETEREGPASEQPETLKVDGSRPQAVAYFIQKIK